jgi:transglutaminase-like putative cysteine protease
VRFTIRHQTIYTYCQPISLAPHTLRFQPRSDGGQLLRSFELLVTPEPAVLTYTLDAEGNTVARAWFSGQHQRVTVTSRAAVETTRTNPFDYLLETGATRLPLAYSDALRKRLALALERPPRAEHEGAGGDEVHQFAAELNADADGVVGFLDRLRRELHASCDVVRREEGPPLAPAETLRTRRGACRDLAVLFIDACRAMGLATRFVSGYQEPGVHPGESSRASPEPEQLERDLHAWAEVFLPGGGWRGYDPTHGLAVADRHVAVAAAADPADAAPVTGAFHGTATATMTTEVSINFAVAQGYLPAQQHQFQQ